MDIQILQKLEEPFNGEVKSRNAGNGRVFRYVDTQSVILRLNQAFAGQWSFEIGSFQIGSVQI